MDVNKAIFIGILAGLLISFIDSYSYAISGYTTAEISLIVIPFLVILFYKSLGIAYKDIDIVTSTAFAYGICITITLTSGMYITYGFLSNVSTRLKVYGLNVAVPQQLFSGGFLDVTALPTYVSLSLASFGGVLLAFAIRGHFIEKERLRYPIGFASAILTKLLSKTFVPAKIAIPSIALGFLLQFLYMRGNVFLDLTPITSSILPGTIFAISFWPIVVGLLFLIPLDPLRMISLGSLITYLVAIPLTITVFKVKVIPALGYEEALYSYSPIVVGLNIGVVFVLMFFYILIYGKTLYTSFIMMFKLRMERTIFVLGILMLSLLGYLAISISPGGVRIFYLHIIIPVVFLHILLTIVNLRVVGEAGIGSQALLPIVTMYMYLSGTREVTTYATLDPYTGIPMPQVIGGSAMNLIRFARFFRYDIIKLLLYFGLGMLVGSFITYLYGNILTYTYGFVSQYMPLSRWIPTITWMASIYSGKLGEAPLLAISLGIFMGLPIVFLGIRKHIPVFPFVVGMTMPPDIGIISLLVFVFKAMLVKLGVEAHEKIIILSILFLIGCGLAVATNTIIAMFS